MTQPTKPVLIAFIVRTDEEVEAYLDELTRQDRPAPGRYKHSKCRNSTINKVFRLLKLCGIKSPDEIRDRLNSANGSAKNI